MPIKPVLRAVTYAATEMTSLDKAGAIKVLRLVLGVLARHEQ